MQLDELLKILTQFPDSEQKKELISKAEGLAAKTNYFKEKYAGRTDEEAVKESRNLEKEIDLFMQKGYDSLKGFGDMLNGHIGRKESRFKKIWKNAGKYAFISAAIVCIGASIIIPALVKKNEEKKQDYQKSSILENSLSDAKKYIREIELERDRDKKQINSLQNKVEYLMSETGVQKEIEKAQKEIEKIKMEEGKERTRIIIEKNKEIARIAAEKEELAIENAGNKNKYETEKQKIESQRKKTNDLEEIVKEQQELIERLQPIRIQMEKPAGTTEKESQGVYMYIVPGTSGLENRLASGGKDAVFYYEEKGKAFHVIELLGKGKFKHGRVNLDEPAVFLGNAGTVLYFYNERKKEVFTMNYGSDGMPTELPEDVGSKIYEIRKEEKLMQLLEELKTKNPHYANMGYQHAEYDLETDTLILAKDKTIYTLKSNRLNWQKECRCGAHGITNIETKKGLLFLILEDASNKNNYEIHALDLSDAGKEIWANGTSLMGDLNKVWCDENRIYVYTHQQYKFLRDHINQLYQLHAYTFRSGNSSGGWYEVRAEFNNKLDESQFSLNPNISSEIIGISNNHKIQIFKKDRIWWSKFTEIDIDKSDKERRISTNLAVTDGYIYFGTNDGTIYAHKIDGLEKK